MVTNIAIPKLGMSMTRATLIEWKAKEGGWVEKDSIVLVIETEKTGWEVKADIPGYLHILVEEGKEVGVSRVVGMIAATKEELEALQKEPQKEIYTTDAEVKAAPQVGPAPSLPGAVSVSRRPEGERIRISPVARKMAEEHMIDITKIVGTGPGGRIVQEDVEKAIEAKKKMGVPLTP